MATITLSDSLQSDLEAIVKDSKEFSDVSAYVSYILQQVVEKKKQAAPVSAQTNYSKEDEDKIKERLKNLGYLD